jgi:hypothetical protein
VNVDYPIKSAPAVANLDGDAEWEVIGANLDGVLKFVNMVPASEGTVHHVYLPAVNR